MATTGNLQGFLVEEMELRCLHSEFREIRLFELQCVPHALRCLKERRKRAIYAELILLFPQNLLQIRTISAMHEEEDKSFSAKAFIYH